MKGYLLGREDVEMLRLWLGSDAFEKRFCTGVHVNVALDVLWCFFIDKVCVVICVAFNIAEYEGDVVVVEEAIHFHFQVYIAFRQ